MNDNEPLRIAHVVGSLHVGGAERFAVDLAIAQRRCGELPTIVAMFDGGPLAEAVRSGGVSCRIVERKIKRDPIAWIKLLRILHELDPHIVHLHDSIAVMLGAPAARVSSRAAIVAVRHDIRSLGRPRDRFIRAAERAITISVASSRAVARFLETVGHARDMPIVPCGIDVARFTYRDPDPRAGPRILTMGRLDTQKGHAVLIDAFARLGPAWPDATLTIAGEGPLAAPLAARARALGVASRVRFAGVEPHSPRLFADADLFCFPSLWEAQGLALLEAQASGVPVIASRVDGIVEAVVDGKTGVLVPPGDPDALRTAIARLCGDGAARIAIARAARAAVFEWEIDGVWRRYEPLYRTALRLQSTVISSWRTAAS